MSSSVFLSVTFFFLMIRRPPRSTLDRSSAASDVYKRQAEPQPGPVRALCPRRGLGARRRRLSEGPPRTAGPVSYTHLRAHETVLDLVCRLLLEKKKNSTITSTFIAATKYTSTNTYTSNRNPQSTRQHIQCIFATI